MPPCSQSAPKRAAESLQEATRLVEITETTITAAELCTCGMWDGSTAATACWTGKRSKYAWTKYARSEGRTRGPWPGGLINYT